MIQYFLYTNTFKLESGQQLNQVRIAYSIFGNPNAKETVWVCHALSGNSIVPEWWGGIFGEDKLFDFNKYRVVCANVIGSCYGSTGAHELDDPTIFPIITIKDIVKGLSLLRSHLEIDEIDILIGASLGGQQALEWSIEEPERINKLILIATNAVHSPFGKAFNEAQRLALLSDQTFFQKGGGHKGLKAARAMAMLSYRSYEDFELKQKDANSKIEDYRAASYVRYQGEKFVGRFEPAAYYTLTKSMDSHDVARGRKSVLDALSSVTARTLVVGVDSDLLFPLTEQQYLADNIADADLGVINSVHGHDAFLIEYEQLIGLIQEFLENNFNRYKPTVLKTNKDHE